MPKQQIIDLGLFVAFLIPETHTQHPQLSEGESYRIFRSFNPWLVTALQKWRGAEACRGGKLLTPWQPGSGE